MIVSYDASHNQGTVHILNRDFLIIYKHDLSPCVSSAATLSCVELENRCDLFSGP